MFPHGNQAVLGRRLGIDPRETRAVLWSALLFYLLLNSYYILRPLREEMGLAGGVDNLPRLFLVTLGAMALVAPLVGWMVRRFSREMFIPLALRFFAANLVLFYLLLRLGGDRPGMLAGRVFYVWVSVFNLVVVSLFWAFMADGFGYDRSRRLFGLIAAGGTLGAIGGSGTTSLMVGIVGRPNLMLLSALLLELAVRCVGTLAREFRRLDPTGHPGAPSRRDGGIWAGITRTLASPYLLGISSYIFLYSLTSTFLYFEQARIVAEHIAGREARASLFGLIDLLTNALTLVCQVLLTGRLLRRLGSGPVLAVLPVATIAGFLALGAWPTLSVLVAFQVLRRAGNYALAKPARETLFTVVDREERYKAKNFIDTFVYRGGDALGAGISGRLIPGLAAAWPAVPAAAVWAVVAILLGRRQQRMAGRTPLPSQESRFRDDSSPEG